MKAYPGSPQNSFRPKWIKRRIRRARRGFALIITVSLMILLSLLAVGLLSLSSIAMRSSSQGDAMNAARGNARMALMMAIGQLQKNVGPDQRITAPANLVNPANPPGVAGAWESWRPPLEGGDYDGEKSERFLGYMTSEPSPGTPGDAASLPSGELQLLVGPGTLGSAPKEAEVNAPLVPIDGEKNPGAMAWAVLDEGVKGRIDLLPNEGAAASEAESVTRVGSPARNKAGGFDDLDFLDGTEEELRETLPKLISTKEVNLAAGAKDAIGPYFHDFSICSNSVQSDVANGGLKTDLSVLFDGTSLPGDYAQRRLYSGNDTPIDGGRYSDPMWAYYHNYYRLYQETDSRNNPVAGMTASLNRRYKIVRSRDADLGDFRFEPDLGTLTEATLMPTLARVEIAFSLVARDVHGSRAAGLRSAGFPYLLHLMYLPVITLHNPYNVPLSFTELEAEFADLPMGFQFLVNNQPATNSLVAFNQLYVRDEAGNKPKIFKIVLTGDLNRATEVVMGPGETRIFGKPFPPDWKWTQEDAGGATDGVKMFDWENDMTNGNRVMPGMITGPNDGVGYDVDWLAPRPQKAAWLNARTGEGIIPLRDIDQIGVRYGPMEQRSSRVNKFSVTLRLKNRSTLVDYATTQVFFKDEARLKEIVEEGTSPRFSAARSFPETYPKPSIDSPISTLDIYETNNTPVKDYIRARPFALFSLSGKTTQDSFTLSRPAADTGATVQMATLDYTTSESQGTMPYEFVLTPVRSGSAVIESDGEKGYFFGGQGAIRGTTASAYYEVPVAPFQSIAQLRHANTACIGTEPYVTYSIGESRAHPALPSGAVRHAASSNRTLLDASWLANDQLWDGYWFSTLASLQGAAYTGTAEISQTELANQFFAGTRSLPNPRNIPYLPQGATEESAATESIEEGGAKTAAHVLTKGGFNVNSVSEAAWTSVLSSLSESSIPLAAGSLESTGESIPVLRTRRPSGGTKSGLSPREELWNSYRKLSPAEVRTLASHIVEEVRERGPFLSMADFVNRRQTSGELGNKGALQAAIDKSGLNGIVEANAFPVTPGDVTSYGWENPEAVDGNTGAGSPGSISQGDLLSSIGSFATVRSDTFRIRCYGDARDPDGRVIARAWCEAVVQRFPDYLDSEDAPEVDATREVNQTFGRRFEVVSFRWLKAEDV